ncbi:MAG TPA: SRPBCC family protein, partial [Gaiellaceae bacterium]|nr:SRPBCC family protein [Gaiellaceae bacterium]
MRLDVLIDEVLPHPVEVVWAALTDRDSISEWLMRTAEFEPVVGARFRMRTQNLSPDGWVRAEVTEVEPPRRMVWAWSVEEAAHPTTVTFELAPHDDGTRLRLTHEGEIADRPGGLLEAGWPVKLEDLKRRL